MKEFKVIVPNKVKASEVISFVEQKIKEIQSKVGEFDGEVINVVVNSQHPELIQVIQELTKIYDNTTQTWENFTDFDNFLVKITISPV